MRQMFKNLKARAFSMVSHDIGIDLGTANTLVYLKGKGIVINEPSVVSINTKTDQVVDIGEGAKNMLGRTPAHIEAIRPLVDGVISNFEVTEQMLTYFINKTLQVVSRKVAGPRVVVGVPSNITNVERRAVRDAARNAGAREVLVVEEPMAAAIGMRLPLDKPVGNMVVDIGGGNTDIAVISLGGIVVSRNIKIAGDRFNQNIANYIRDEFKILVGEKTAEYIKMTTTAIIHPEEPIETVVRGRDLVTGLPREVIITDSDVREALSNSIDNLVESIKGVLESTPPEILADIMQRGIYLAGGGALMRGLPEFLAEWLRIPIHVVDDPLTAVARGTGIILENTDVYLDVLMSNEEAIPINK